jgi:aldose 1-epimerase
MSGKLFFTLPDGRNAHLYQLRLADGFGVDITDFGGCVVSLFTPDAAGKLVDVALGWKEPADYMVNRPYFGAMVGRIPNRISGGRFELDGQIYQTYLNDHGVCTLHGGFGYCHRLWDVESATASELVLTLRSPHGDAGFPGELFVRVSYRVKADHTLEIETSASSDRPTVADLTNHTYFNLDGENYGSIADHFIVMKSGKVTETDDSLQPTGKLIDVAGTRYDLRNGRKFSDIYADYANGFDDNFVLSEKDHDYRENVAVVTAGHSGIRMALHTSRPGVQFYMGGFLNNQGKSFYPKHSGFCLETQGWPDSVNHPHFPQVRVEPGKPHHGISRYVFSVVK